MRDLEARPEWTKGLSERQITAVLQTAETGKITTSEYCRLVNVSNMTAYRDLRELCERALFKQIGKKKVTYYVLA